MSTEYALNESLIETDQWKERAEKAEARVAELWEAADAVFCEWDRYGSMQQLHVVKRPMERLRQLLLSIANPASEAPVNEPVCLCGHVRDEHSVSGECQVEINSVGNYCPCAAFEVDRG